MAALLTFNWQPMQAQSCIDFEVIDEILTSLPDACDCNDPIQLGEAGQVKYITEYHLNTIQIDECFEIFGTLIMDESMYFEDCDFIMDDGALIQLEASFGRPFVFINSNFNTCGDYLWQGIEMLEETQLLFAENTFQHSLKGIHGSNGMVLGIFTENVFSDNYFALDLGDMVGIRSLITAKGNTFAQPNAMKDHWDDPIPSYLDYTHGVQLRNAVFDADASSDPCAMTNIYYKLDRGTRLIKSHSSIHANLYHDFKEKDENIFGSYGIITSRSGPGGFSYLDQSGWHNNEVASFKKVAFPITTENTNTTIKDNIMLEVLEGVRAVKPLVNCDIQNNIIESFLNGIQVQINRADVLRITNNDITIDVDPIHYGKISYGINVLYGRYESKKGIISYNTIGIEEANFGILLSNASAKNLTCNTVRINETADNYTSGIEIRGGSFNSLRENAVMGDYSSTTADEVNGLKLVETTDIRMTANELSNTEFGLHFSGFCAATNQVQNEFNTHDVGYFIDEGGISGEQLFSGNLWLGSYSQWAAQNVNPIVSPSRYIDHVNFYNSDCWPETIDSDPLWFLLAQSQGVCGAPIPIIGCLEKEDPDRPSPRMLDTLIARGDMVFEDFPDRRTWRAERYLYDVLDQFSNLITSSNPLDSFWTDAQNSPIDKYHQLWADVNQLMDLPTSLNGQLHEADSVVSALKAISADIAEDIELLPDSVEIWNQLVTTALQMDSILAEADTAYHSWLDNSRTSMASFQQELDSLSVPDNHYAYNETVVLEAMMELFIDPDTLDPGLENNLKSIASGCILEEGPSVFGAYALLASQGADILSLDFYCEDTDGSRQSVQQHYSPPKTFKLYPNPSGGQIHLTFDQPIDKDTPLQVVDISGILVHRDLIPAQTEQFTLKLDHLRSGKYLIRVDMDGKISTATAIISK